MPDTDHLDATFEHLTAVADQVLASAAEGLITRHDAARILGDRYRDTARWITVHQTLTPLDEPQP